MDIVEDILNDLDAGPLRIRATLPPDAPLPLEVGESEKAGHDGLMDLSTMLYGLYRALRADNSSRLQSLMDACLEKLHLRWADVTKWIMLCAEKISPADPFIPGHWNTVMLYCDRILEPIIFQPEKNHFKREMATTHATIDILFCLLRIIDPRTGRPARLETKPGSGCSIARIFGMYVASETDNCVSSRLDTLPLKTKQEIVQSIIWRMQDSLSMPRNSPEEMAEVDQDLLNLISNSCALIHGMGAGGDFAHRDILFEGAHTLSAVMKDAVARNSPKPTSITLGCCINQLVRLATWPQLVHRAMEGLFGGGIIPCILRSIPYIDMEDPRSRGLKRPAWQLLPYLTDTRIYHAAKKGGGNPELFKELEAIPKPKATESIYNAYSLALRCCKAAFADKNRPVEMCYSLKVCLAGNLSTSST